MEAMKSKGKEGRNIQAVVVLIVSRDGKVLIVQETTNKPQIDKKAGDWTMPAETIEKTETLNDAVKRLIEEEVGEKGDIDYNPEIDYLGDYCFSGFWARAYIMHFEGTSKDLRSFGAKNNEVIGHRWIDPQEIRTMPRRAGVIEVINDYLTGGLGFIRENCQPGYHPQANK